MGIDWTAPIVDTAGLAFGPTALDQSARHAVAPSFVAWIDHRRDRFGLAVGADVAWYTRRVSGEVWDHHRGGVWGAGMVGVGLATVDLAVDWLVGPGLALETGTVGGHRFTEVRPAVRARSAFELRLGGRLVGRFTVGTLARGVARWDFDTTAGVGAAW